MAWGWSLAIDVKHCDPVIIRSKEKIQDYVIQLCKLIDMNRYGDVQIVHFGSGNKEGYSMVQLIETSCITGHFANDLQAAFIDIFTCKEFDPEKAMIFTGEFFGGQIETFTLTDRG